MVHHAVLTLEMAEVVRTVLQAMSESEGECAFPWLSAPMPGPRSTPILVISHSPGPVPCYMHVATPQSMPMSVPSVILASQSTHTLVSIPRSLPVATPCSLQVSPPCCPPQATSCCSLQATPCCPPVAAMYCHPGPTFCSRSVPAPPCHPLPLCFASREQGFAQDCLKTYASVYYGPAISMADAYYYSP